MKHFVDEIGRMWCRLAHDRPMWPIRGEYKCSSCLRTYAVGWEAQPAVQHAPALQPLAVSRARAGY